MGWDHHPGVDRDDCLGDHTWGITGPHVKGHDKNGDVFFFFHDLII